MPRRIKVPDSFPFSLYTISYRDGCLEGSWDLIVDTVVWPLLSRVPRRMVEEALRGHTNPLRQKLGITPEGALRKLPDALCGERRECLHYDAKTCSVLSKKAPWCLVPSLDSSNPDLLDLFSKVVSQWRDSVYVVIVDEEPHV